MQPKLYCSCASLIWFNTCCLSVTQSKWAFCCYAIILVLYRIFFVSSNMQTDFCRHAESNTLGLQFPVCVVLFQNKDIPIENTTDCLSTMASICRVMIENPYVSCIIFRDIYSGMVVWWLKCVTRDKIVSKGRMSRSAWVCTLLVASPLVCRFLCRTELFSESKVCYFTN